jgi:hypothetical protein
LTINQLVRISLDGFWGGKFVINHFLEFLIISTNLHILEVNRYVDSENTKKQKYLNDDNQQKKKWVFLQIPA